MTGLNAESVRVVTKHGEESTVSEIFPAELLVAKLMERHRRGTQACTGTSWPNSVDSQYHVAFTERQCSVLALALALCTCTCMSVFRFAPNQPR
jgi:hypothetical protein